MQQCNHFAFDALARAGIATGDFSPPSAPIRPAYTFQVLSGKKVTAAQWPPTECMKRKGIEFKDNVIETVEGVIQNVRKRFK